MARNTLTYDKRFIEKFPTNESCYHYLAELKWKNGYRCMKCGSREYLQLKRPYARRCRKCGFAEHATEHTLFHKTEIPLRKAFSITVLIMSGQKVVSYKLGRELKISKKNCWLFMRKILHSLKKKRNEILEDDNKMEQLFADIVITD